MTKQWTHPGGKLREEGAEHLTEAELLAILISSGVRGHSAQDIAEDLLDRYGSIGQLAGRPLEELLAIRGLSDVKIIRIAAAMEVARRLSTE